MISPDFAKAFWKTVLNRTVEWDDRLVALAVHKAILDVREDVPDNPLACDLSLQPAGLVWRRGRGRIEAMT